MRAEIIEGRRRIFAEKVAEGHTATEAYLLAGYRPAKRETAHRAASRLYAQAEIRAYIQDLRRAGDELAREETTLTIARKLAFLVPFVLTSSSATLPEPAPQSPPSDPFQELFDQIRRHMFYFGGSNIYSFACPGSRDTKKLVQSIDWCSRQDGR